ncbi:MAG: hypothetical protein M5U09_22325 [Gammaproteobacteria bacterium]|nr:hypothetical protein [Gammaproteobacteria bacterium]
MHNLAEMKDLAVRMQGAPLDPGSSTPSAPAPTVIAYNEVYNGIQTGVIAAAENEAAGIEQMKFLRGRPECRAGQACDHGASAFHFQQDFPEASGEAWGCIMEAGREAGKYGRDIENGEDAAKLKAMEEKGWLTTIAFTDRDKMLELANPVLQAYAEEARRGRGARRHPGDQVVAARRSGPGALLARPVVCNLPIPVSLRPTPTR